MDFISHNKTRWILERAEDKNLRKLGLLLIFDVVLSILIYIVVTSAIHIPLGVHSEMGGDQEGEGIKLILDTVKGYRKVFTPWPCPGVSSIAARISRWGRGTSIHKCHRVLANSNCWRWMEATKFCSRVPENWQKSSSKPAPTN